MREATGPRPQRRRPGRPRGLAIPVAAIAVVGIVVIGALAAGFVEGPRDPAARASAAREQAAGVRLAAEVTESALGAMRAPGDFGIEDGIRSVPVRLVERLTIRLRLATAGDLVLAGPPRVCLVGPFWNPLDAGLEDRCWGEPDLGAAVGARLARDAAGRVVLRAAEPLELELAIQRGDRRCDYAPGPWRVQVDGEPLIDGVATGRLDLADVPVIIPLEAPGTVLPFHPNAETRPCSYTAAVYTRQGAPEYEEPGDR